MNVTTACFPFAWTATCKTWDLSFTLCLISTREKASEMKTEWLDWQMHVRSTLPNLGKELFPTLFNMQDCLPQRIRQSQRALIQTCWGSVAFQSQRGSSHYLSAKTWRFSRWTYTRNKIFLTERRQIQSRSVVPAGAPSRCLSLIAASLSSLSSIPPLSTPLSLSQIHPAPCWAAVTLLNVVTMLLSPPVLPWNRGVKKIFKGAESVH